MKHDRVTRDCAKGKHRRRDNKHGVTWCIDCGLLSTKPSGIPLTDVKLFSNGQWSWKKID